MATFGLSSCGWRCEVVDAAAFEVGVSLFVLLSIHGPAGWVVSLSRSSGAQSLFCCWPTSCSVCWAVMFGICVIYRSTFILCCVKWHIYILKCNATLSFNVSTSVCLQETVINSLNSASRCFTAAVFYCVEFICCWRGTNHTDIYFDYCLLTDECNRSVHLFDTNKAHYTHCTRFFWLFRSISLSVWQRHVSNSCSMFSLMWMRYTVASERLRLLCGLWAAPAVSSLTHNICKWIRMIIWRTCVLL